MLNKIKFNRLWQILGPVIIYLCVYGFGAAIIEIISKGKIAGTSALLLAAIITFFPEYYLYKNSPKWNTSNYSSILDALKDVLYILLIVIVGFVANKSITHFINIINSSSFENANEVLETGSLLIRVLCLGVVIPVLEELIYRGLIAGQLFVMKVNPVVSIFISSFLFAFLHLNLVQFIYAFVTGIVLGFSYFKTKRLLVCILGHSILNLIVLFFV